MKKLALIFAMLTIGIGTMMAQGNYKAIKGYVVDKNGNPIPGAEVMAPGGGESVITDSDGSFYMNVHPLLKKITATYDGMTTKTLKIKSDKDLIFRLKKERVRPAFLNILIGGTINTHGYGGAEGGLSFGIMAGMLGKWGFYGKLSSDWYGSFSTTIGAIKSIYKRKTFIYAGLGYGMALRGYQYEYEDPYSSYTYWNWWDDYRPGIAGDFGFIFKTGRHFNLTIGYNIIRTFPFESHHYTYVGSNYVHGVQVGLGYVF